MAARITTEEIEQWQNLCRLKSEFDRQARSAETGIKALADKFKAAIESQGSEDATLKVGKYRLALIDGPRYPKWKEACLEKLGALECAKIEEATAPSKKLHLSPA